MTKRMKKTVEKNLDREAKLMKDTCFKNAPSVTEEKIRLQYTPSENEKSDTDVAVACGEKVNDFDEIEQQFLQRSYVLNRKTGR